MCSKHYYLCKSGGEEREKNNRCVFVIAMKFLRKHTYRKLRLLSLVGSWGIGMERKLKTI